MIEDNGFNIECDPTHGAVIYVSGDEQRGSPGFVNECFEDMVNRFRLEPGPKYYLHVGDLHDWLRPTMREKVEGATVGDPSARKMLDEFVRNEQDRILDKYEIFKDRTVGCHEGHHNWKFMDGGSTDQRFAAAMRSRQLGWIAATRLRILTKGAKANYAYSKTMVSTHGSGGGKSAGSDAVAVDNLAKGFFADIYVRGHSCGGIAQPGYARREVRREGPLGVIKRTPWYINTPGMCEGYTNGWATSYAERAGFTPKALGWCTIRLKIVMRRQGALDLGIGPGGKKHRRYAHSVEVAGAVHLFDQ